MPVSRHVVAAVALAAVACATTNASAFAEVEDYIANANCKDNYLHRPVCVGNGECYAHGTDEQNGCTSVEQWKWPEHAVGVLPHPRKRVTANGSAKQKHVWAYLGDVSQGEAIDMYNKKGAATVTQVLNTPVNQLSFIANVNVEKPSAWFVPGANNTNGCGQMQTWDLPFGFDGKSSQVLEFHQNLQKLHSNGITITLTMGSWCTQFPIKKGEEWTDSMFGEFVSYFRQLRVNTFGGALDGIDFDWEGFCNAECLKGQCSCAWSDAECAGLSPDALAAGHSWMEPDSHGVAHKKFCWMFPTHSTIQVMAGIFALSLRCVVFLWRCLHCVVFVCCLLSDKSPPIHPGHDRHHPGHEGRRLRRHPRPDVDLHVHRRPGHLPQPEPPQRTCSLLAQRGHSSPDKCICHMYICQHARLRDDDPPAPPPLPPPCSLYCAVPNAT
jgi:hypothetical protein